VAHNIAVVIGSFHKNEGLDMLDEVRSYAKENDLNILAERWVPGSMEKPLALKQLLNSDDIHGAVVLGIIEKGETKHGLVMADAVIKSIIEIQLDCMKPVGVGILGPEIQSSQIPSRVRPYALAAVKAMAVMLDESGN
jgi:6,7-dimethyl-8-ribityllumazine synthase